ncbi:MAG: hypothetical protein MI922_06650, partial [Bacteroidales bacterium]|nr:hypothetical protein [Bacteroidales bacterium]
MKRGFISLLFFVFFISANAVEDYVPQYSNPLLDSWRWYQIGQFNTSGFAEITQDSSGTIWAAFNNTNAPLKSYDGYTWQSHSCNMKNPVGQVNELRILGDSILIGGTNGLMSFKDGSYTYLIRPSENLDYQLMILAIVPVWDSCLVIATSNGLIFNNGNRKYFYTIEDKVDSFNVKLPGYQVIPLPLSTYSNARKDYFINAVVERSNNQLWMFAQLNGPKSLLVQRTGKKEEPLEFKIIDDFKGKPRFGMDTEVLAGNNDLWLVSKSNFRMASWFDGQKWQLQKLQSLYGESNIHYSIVRMDNGHILIGGDKVIYDYHKGNYTHYKYPEVPLGKVSEVKLLKTIDGNLLVGLHNKIYLVEYNNKKWVSLLNLLYQCEGDVSQEADGQRTKWYISKQNKIISYKNGEWQSFDVKDGVIDAPVAVSISSDGTVWCVGSHNSGAAFCVFNNGRWYKTLLDTIAASFSKQGAFEDKNGDVWIASSDLNRRKKKQGVLKVSNQSGTLEFEYYASPKNVYAGFAIPPNGDLIAFTYHYKYAFDKTNNNWETMTIRGGSVLSSAQSRDGNLWMATKSDGLYLWDTTGVEKFKVPDYLNIKRFLSIHHNSSALWLVSDDGFYAYAQKHWLSNVFPSDILMLSEKCDINSDRHGKIWMNIYPEQWYHRVFYNDNYNKQSPFLTIGYQSDIFAPRMIEIEYNNKVDHRGNTYIRWKGADFNKWTSDDNLLYSYKLGDKPWTDFSYNTVQTFTALPHGNYSLQVRCMDTDFNISHEPIVAKFKVYPPVYKQTWFIVQVSTLTAIILFLIYRAMRRNRKLSMLNNNLRYANQQLKEKQEEILTQQEEVYQSKLRFFTNISHEFRTPLTLILGPIKQLKKKFDQAMIEKILPVIERNSDILLNLVNEIMDFRKLDAGHMKLGARETNMHDFC